MECLRLSLIQRHVFAVTRSPTSRLNRKKENGIVSFETGSERGARADVSVETILEGQTTGREFRWKYRLRHPRICPSNLSLALDAPLALHSDSWRAKPPPCPGFFMMLIYIYISIDTPMNRCFHSQILFSFRFFVVFLFVFPFFFFGSNLYSGLEEKFYFITRYIGFFANRNEPSRIHPIRILYTRYQFRFALLFKLVI